MNIIKNPEEILKIYKNNKVILCDVNNQYKNLQLIRQFQVYEIDVFALYSDDIYEHKSFDNINIINSQELSALSTEKYIIQIVNYNDAIFTKTVDKLNEIGIQDYLMFSVDEMRYLFNYMKKNNIVDITSKFIHRENGKNIPITQIDSEFSIYRNKKVIIWGAGNWGMKLLDLFNYHKIEVYAFCDIDLNLYGKNIEEINIINFDDIKNMVFKNDNIIIQIGVLSTEYSNKIIEDIKVLGDGNIPYVTRLEAYSILGYIERFTKLDITTEFSKYIDKNKNVHNNKKLLLSKYLNETSNTKIIVCTEGKTGDVTWNKTLEKHNVNYINMWHSPNNFDRNDFKDIDNIKVITGVREPISKSLSTVYYWLSELNNYAEEIYNFSNPFEIETIYRYGGDIQYLFDRFMEWNILNNTTMWFMNHFSQHFIDITKTSFDTEKGYTIIKDGNIEIFVYQLEKLNSIVKEASGFIGVEFDKWEIGNIADDKWIADSYKLAQKQIKISQEYFDKCFDDKYIKHCYSEKDIEKFKERWRPQIIR